MKTNILKGGKRLTGVLLAVVILLGSLFVANVGVSFTADAESVSVEATSVWDGKTYDDELSGTGSESDPYLITSAAELAYVALQVGSASNGKHYKVADGLRKIYINEPKAVDAFDADEQAVFTNNNWTIVSADCSFWGTFDGNGVTVLGISNNDGNGGLFPLIKGSVTVKNVKVANSYISGNRVIGAVIGQAWSDMGDVKLESCVVTNCYIAIRSKDKHPWALSAAGLFGGGQNPTSLFINNCIVYNNNMDASSGSENTGTYTSGTSTESCGGYGTSAFIGHCGLNQAKLVVQNSIAIDDAPWAVYGSKYTRNCSNYTNVYTNISWETNFEITNGTYSTTACLKAATTDVNEKTVAEMQGVGKVAALKLDPVIWGDSPSSYPEILAVNDVTYKSNGASGHSRVCEELGLNDTIRHTFKFDQQSNKDVCVYCGYSTPHIEIWNGTQDSIFKGEGTAEQPFIIETAEQLNAMAMSSGLDANGKQLYYKVADGVTAFYLNDVRGFANVTEFKSSTGKTNWSKDVASAKAPSKCEGGCEHTKPSITSMFEGVFDGNGATVYGLYSETNINSFAMTGSGFFPALTGNAIVKNISFDMSYVKSATRNAAVLTSSTGIHTWNITKENWCDFYKQRHWQSANLTVMNVSVFNTYCETTTYQVNDDARAYVGGIMAGHSAPATIAFENCLYDGTNSVLSSTDGGTTYSAGIYALAGLDDMVSAANCVSVGETKAFDTCSDTKSSPSAKIRAAYTVAAAEATKEKMPLLNWAQWSVADGKLNVGTIKRNKFNAVNYYINDYAYGEKYKFNGEGYTDDYLNGLDYLEYGSRPIENFYESGLLYKYNQFEGSGSEADPYIIRTATQLFQVIASGGTNRGQKLYYKLGCDIDLGGIDWLDTNTIAHASGTYKYYVYKAFTGVIDGDNHTVSGLYKATSSDGAIALIPELNGGTVKNLNLSDSYVYNSVSGKTGYLVGNAVDAQIINCSTEADNAVGTINGFTATNCRFGTKYYNADSTQSANADLSAVDANGNKLWYKGGENTVPRLLAIAQAMPCADIDGDGKGYYYSAADMSALKSHLLWDTNYANIYGDVSRNGVTNISDLAVLRRVFGDNYNTAADGLWRNVQLGKVKIYYTDNDLYDFARSLELYFESKTGTDIEKVVGAAPSENAVVLVDNNSTGTAYSFTYDKTKSHLTVTGDNFTAVEAAVDAFIKGSDYAKGTVYTTNGTIDTDKAPTTVDNKNYFYAWGDEFSTDGELNYGTWSIRAKTDDKTVNEGFAESEFANLKLAGEADLLKLNEIKNNKLYMHRGVDRGNYSGNSGTYTADGVPVAFDSNDYAASGIINTNKSMLFKRGYLEMNAKIPADGIAFPAWWLLTDVGLNNQQAANSLYSKVYPENPNYNGAYYYDSLNYNTYKYQIPTFSYELDLFEVIQKPTYNSRKLVQTGDYAWSGEYRAVLEPSTDNNLYLNIHKWYTHAQSKSGNTLSFNRLDWANTSAERVNLLTATKNGDTYTVTNSASTIGHHAENIKNGQLNAAINENQSNIKYWGTVNKNTLTINPTVSEGYIEAKVGFLWNETKVTYYLNGEAKATVETSKMDYNNDIGDNLNQYAYMLIDNHFHTNENGNTNEPSNLKDIIVDKPMVIDYVRIYQLDGKRDIITPETEAFNSDNRFGN